MENGMIQTMTRWVYPRERSRFRRRWQRSTLLTGMLLAGMMLSGMVLAGFPGVSNLATANGMTEANDMTAEPISSSVPSTSNDLDKEQDRSKAYQTDRFEVKGDPLIEVYLNGGSIEFEGRDGGEVVIDTFVRQDGRYVNQQNFEGKLKLDLSQNGDKIVLRGDVDGKKGWFGWFDGNTSLHIRVTGPAKSSVNFTTSGGELDVKNLHSIATLKTSGGDIDLEDVSGKFDLQTSGGSIDIEQASGTFFGRTSGGSIDLEDTDGSFELRTSGGSIDVENAIGTYALRTSGGSIDVEKGRGDFSLKTSAGNIDVDELWGSVDATTSAGNVDVTVMDLLGDITLKTSAGNIDLYLPVDAEFSFELKGMETEAALQGFSASNVQIIQEEKKIMNQLIIGEVGGAVYKVNARTSAGAVTLMSLD